MVQVSGFEGFSGGPRTGVDLDVTGATVRVDDDDQRVADDGSGCEKDWSGRSSYDTFAIVCERDRSTARGQCRPLARLESEKTDKITRRIGFLPIERADGHRNSNSNVMHRWLATPLGELPTIGAGLKEVTTAVEFGSEHCFVYRRDHPRSQLLRTHRLTHRLQRTDGDIGRSASEGDDQVVLSADRLTAEPGVGEAGRNTDIDDVMAEGLTMVNSAVAAQQPVGLGKQVGWARRPPPRMPGYRAERTGEEDGQQAGRMARTR